MLDTCEDLAIASGELGCAVEQLVTPLTRRKLQTEAGMYAIDNGAFARFEKARFLALLNRLDGTQERCRFVAAPDVVGSARRTLEAFAAWRRTLQCKAWPVALVAQDGLEDLEIPWHQFAAIFVGGSTKWKLSKAAADVIRTGLIMDKWVHVGRVNSPARFEYFETLGAHSIDGTGLARYSHMREAIHRQATQPGLLTAAEACNG